MKEGRRDTRDRDLCGKEEMQERVSVWRVRHILLLEAMAQVGDEVDGCRVNARGRGGGGWMAVECVVGWVLVNEGSGKVVCVACACGVGGTCSFRCCVL